MDHSYLNSKNKKARTSRATETLSRVSDFTAYPLA